MGRVVIPLQGHLGTVGYISDSTITRETTSPIASGTQRPLQTAGAPQQLALCSGQRP
jgi:hypothetical protein